jgi:hypothetical protein
MLNPLPASIHSLADLFEFSCRQKPQELAYAFVRDNLELESQLTYGDSNSPAFIISTMDP